MKKTIILLTLLAALLTACTGASSAQVNPTQTGTDLSAETQLAVGTLKLEDTNEALTDEQAGELLVLWKAYKALSTSDIAAQAELDGLNDQIQETMTTAQLDTISAMDLTQQDVFSLMENQDVGPESSQQSGSAVQMDAGFAPSDGGGMAGGTPPDGGGMDVMAGTGLDMGATSTSGDTQTVSSTSASTTVPTVLVNTLISTLEQIVNV